MVEAHLTQIACNLWQGSLHCQGFDGSLTMQWSACQPGAMSELQNAMLHVSRSITSRATMAPVKEVSFIHRASSGSCMSEALECCMEF